jgi:hypothetical protein
VTTDRRDQHPEELLADFVDGTLEGEDRARVEGHLSGCARCREEVALAGRARGALAGLSEVAPPPGLDLAVRREVRRPPSRRVWALAGAAAVAAGILAGGVVLVGQGLLGGEPGQPSEAGAPQPAQEQDTTQGATEEKAPSSLATRNAATSIRFTTSQQDYTPASLANLGRSLRDDARALLAQGFPRTAEMYFADFEVESLAKDVREAVQCVLAEVPANQPVVPILVQKASFEGTPAYVAAFLQGPSPTTPYDRLLIWVVDRETCSLSYYAAQRL